MSSRLYERTEEISAIDAALDRLGKGRGSCLVLEGRAGCGKSTLMDYAVERGRERGARTWVVRARHLASAAPFEVLRRLLGPAVEEAGGVEALDGAARFAIPLFTPGADLSQGVDYGCQWLIAWLAERSPLVLAIDDAHWADGASLRVLLDVQADISAQPVTMLVASRPVENQEVQGLLAAMAAQPECQVLVAGDALARGRGRGRGGQARSTRHRRLRRRVPQGLARQRVLPPRAAAGPTSRDSRPNRQSFVRNGTLSLRRTVAWRLARARPRGHRAGAGCSRSWATAARCTWPRSWRGSRRRPRSSTPPGSRWRASSSTATLWSSSTPCSVRRWRPSCPTWSRASSMPARPRLLWLSGEPPESVALHLVNSPGSGDAEVAAFLTEEGEAALEAGSIALATQLLRRALDEPAPAGERPRILVALGRAEHALSQLDVARQHLEAAMESDDRPMMLTAAAELFDVLLDAGQFADLGRLHQRVVELDPTGDSLAELRLQAQLLGNVFMAVEPGLTLPPGLAEIDAHDLPVERDIQRYLLVTVAIFERTMQRGTTQGLVDNLRRAVAGLQGLQEGSLSLWDARAALEAATFLADDEFAEADAIFERLGSSVSRLRASAPSLQSELAHRRLLSALGKGDYEDVLAAITLAEQRTAHPEKSRFTAGYRFIRGWIALERGDYAAAGELLVGEDG